MSPEIYVLVDSRISVKEIVTPKPTPWKQRKAAILKAIFGERSGYHRGPRPWHALMGVILALERACSLLVLCG